MRVVSLLPSATELCCALGVDPVGVTHECDYPSRMREVPTVVHSRIDTDGSSRDIDRSVEEVVTAGGVYRLDSERLRDLDPDVVVTQGLCDVCAVDEAVVADAISELGIDAELVATHPHTLADVFEDIERLGRVLDREAAASTLLTDLHERVEAVELRAPATDRPTVTVLDWLDPVMVSGHWVPELVDIAGGDFELGTAGVESGPVEWAQVRDTDPDALVVAPCGFGVDRTADAMADLTTRPGFEDLQAVRDGRVYLVDGTHYVNRPGPRIVDTLEAFAGLLHPDRFEAPAEAFARPLSEFPESV